MSSLSLAVGIACPLACKGCYYNFPFSELRGEYSNKLIKPEEVIAFTDFLIENYDLEKVTLCGGDPLSHPDIFSILQGLKDSGLFISLDTVGSNFIEDVTTIFPVKIPSNQVDIDHIKQFIDVLGIPLDGSNQELCSVFRIGRKSLFSETLQILATANQLNVPVSINTVGHKQNMHDLENILDIVLKHPNIFRIQIFQFSPIGKMAHHNWKKFVVSDEDFTARIAQLKEKYADTHIIIDAKMNDDRVNKYVMVDCFGRAFFPDAFHVVDDKIVKDELIVVGDIKNQEDYLQILKTLKANDNV